MDSIAFDMLFKICYYLNYKDLINLSVTNSYYKDKICDNNEFWYRRFIKDFRLNNNNFINILNDIILTKNFKDFDNIKCIWKYIYSKYNFYYIILDKLNVTKTNNIMYSDYLYIDDGNTLYLHDNHNNFYTKESNDDHPSLHFNSNTIDTDNYFNNYLPYDFTGINLLGNIQFLTRLKYDYDEIMKYNINSLLTLTSYINYFIIDNDYNLWVSGPFLGTNFKYISKTNIKTKYITIDKELKILYYIDLNDEIYYIEKFHTNNNIQKLILNEHDKEVIKFKHIYLFDDGIALILLNNDIYIKGNNHRNHFDIDNSTEYLSNFIKFPHFKGIDIAIYHGGNEDYPEFNYSNVAIIDIDHNIWLSHSRNNYKFTMIPNIKATKLSISDDTIYCMGLKY